MLARFNRRYAERHYPRLGLVSTPTALDCSDSHVDKDRWPHPAVADNFWAVARQARAACA